MSIDFVALVNVVAPVVTAAILLLGMYRALEMRRVFVNSVYRSRATWSGFLMLIILIQVINGFVSYPNSGILSVIGSLPVFALLLTIFAFSDRSVLVAMETDFFHRNTLGWLRVRWPATIVLVISFLVAIAIGSFNLPSLPAQPPLWEVLVENLAMIWFVVIAIVLAYAAVALIVGARRSADRNLRRSVLLIGLAILTLVLSIVLTIPFSGGLPYAIIYQGSTVIGIYLIYRSVMSLSPIGRIEKQIV